MNQPLIPFFYIVLLLTGFLPASGSMQQSLRGRELSDSLRKTYLALGDSYTIGESVKPGDRFPAQAVARLKAKGILFNNPEYIAQTGWTTADLQDAIKKEKLKPKYDMVSLLMGVNDQYQGLDTAGYRERVTQLLQNAIRLTGGLANHVFVLSIPDYSVTPFGGGSKKIQEEIDAFNRINKQVAEKYEVNYIDITPISRKAVTDQSYTASDGLHPSARQYAEWALQLTSNIIKQL
jgi:lysophospholipase L1-like esterase